MKATRLQHIALAGLLGLTIGGTALAQAPAPAPTAAAKISSVQPPAAPASKKVVKKKVVTKKHVKATKAKKMKSAADKPTA